MGWTSYYVGSKSLKDCMADEMAKFPKYNHKIKKSVQKGNNFYYLMESPKGEDWVLDNEPKRNIKLKFTNNANEEKFAILVNCKIMEKQNMNIYVILAEEINLIDKIQ
jgi:hypothetical protein